MKKISYLGFLSFFYIISCVSFVNSEKRTQEKFCNILTEDGKKTYGNYFAQLAGLRGEVKYNVFGAEGETNPDVKVIQVFIDKKDTSAKYRTAKIQYQFNEKTGFIMLSYLVINGEAKSLFIGSLDLELMLMESTMPNMRNKEDTVSKLKNISKDENSPQLPPPPPPPPASSIQ